MKIIKIKTTDIKPYDKNPRKNDSAVDMVANSIKEFGFKVPIIIDKNNIIVTGHTRHKAAKKLGLKEVPVIIADDLTDEQIKAFRLADNKVGEIAEWDFNLLGEELDELLLFDIDMADFGFDDNMEQELQDIDSKNERGVQTGFVLNIDGDRVLMTEEEATSIKQLLNEYVEENGVSFGFVRYLINDKIN